MNLRPGLLLPVILYVVQPAFARGAITVTEESSRLSSETMRQRAAERFTEEGTEDQISQVVRTMYQDTRGDLWFGTQDGICRYDGATLMYYDIRDEHDQGITVKDIVEDRNGDIWFGTSGGITRFDGEFFTTFTEADGLPDRDVWCLCADREGRIWIGAYEGACRFDGRTFTPFPLPPAAERDPNRGISSRTIVLCIIEDHAGSMWFAAEGGVYEYDGERLARVPVLEGDSELQADWILEDGNRDLWFSTRYGGMVRFDGRAYEDVLQTDRARGSGVGRACQDEKGGIWFPGGDGLYRYDGKSLTRLIGQDGFAGPKAQFAYADRGGRIWLGGWNGVCRYEGETFVKVTRDGPWE